MGVITVEMRWDYRTWSCCCCIISCDKGTMCCVPSSVTTIAICWLCILCWCCCCCCCCICCIWCIFCRRCICCSCCGDGVLWMAAAAAAAGEVSGWSSHRTSASRTGRSLIELLDYCKRNDWIPQIRWSGWWCRVCVEAYYESILVD